MSSVLIIFAKCPDPGQCKTRLISAVGATGAARIHRHLLRETLRTAATCWPNCQIRVCHAGVTLGELEQDVRQFCPTAHLSAQVGADLGARLQLATREAFLAGAERVVVIGTDCPKLSARHVSEAFDQLGEHDIVLGPAVDGGYYLVGLSRDVPGLFQNIDWSTVAVLQQTLKNAQRDCLKARMLETLADVDVPADLTPELVEIAQFDSQV